MSHDQYYFFFWPRHHKDVACGILVLQPGIELMSPALEAWSLNPWTIKEFHMIHIFIILCNIQHK